MRSLSLSLNSDDVFANRLQRGTLPMDEEEEVMVTAQSENLQETS